MTKHFKSYWLLFWCCFQIVMTSHALESQIALPELPVFKEEGKPVALGSFKDDDEVLVLVFVASTCPITSLYWKRIKGAWYNYRDKKVKMVLVGGNSDDKYEDIKKVIEEQQLELPLVWDSKHILAKQLGMEFTPSVAVLGHDWKTLYRGKIDDFWRNEEPVKQRYMESAIQNAMEDKKSPDHVKDTFTGSRMR